MTQSLIYGERKKKKKGRELERMWISEPAKRVSIINNKLKKSQKYNSLSIIEDTLVAYSKV
jgi:hypothetical protein